MPQFVNKWFPKHPSKDNYLTLTLFTIENKMCTAPMPQSHDEIGVKSFTIVSAIPFTVAAPDAQNPNLHSTWGSAHKSANVGKGSKARGKSLGSEMGLGKPAAAARPPPCTGLLVGGRKNRVGRLRPGHAEKTYVTGSTARVL